MLFRICSHVKKTVLRIIIITSFHFSDIGLWQHMESSEKEGKILFNWSNSFSQHKKFLSLSICPERPPPFQVSILLAFIVMGRGVFVCVGRGVGGRVCDCLTPFHTLWLLSCRFHHAFSGVNLRKR